MRVCNITWTPSAIFLSELRSFWKFERKWCETVCGATSRCQIKRRADNCQSQQRRRQFWGVEECFDFQVQLNFISKQPSHCYYPLFMLDLSIYLVNSSYQIQTVILLTFTFAISADSPFCVLMCSAARSNLSVATSQVAYCWATFRWMELLPDIR